MSQIRAVIVAGLIIIITLIGIPFQFVFIKTKLPLGRWVPVLYHRIVLKLLRIDIHKAGELSANRPILIVSNHTSWLDILVLSSFLPCSFIAKSEIASWPVFGVLAKLQRTLFVNRQKKSDTQETNKVLFRRLKRGEPMILFAEGTTSEGTRVLPFKSALFGVASMMASESKHKDEISDDQTALYIQPTCVTYQKLQGLPLNRASRLHTAWIGDMDLMPHLWNVIKGGPIDVTVSFSEAIEVDDGFNRKILAKQAENAVREMNVSALRNE